MNETPKTRDPLGAVTLAAALVSAALFIPQPLASIPFALVAFVVSTYRWLFRRSHSQVVQYTAILSASVLVLLIAIGVVSFFAASNA
ncbi:MAG: hypothetical protein Q3979_03180 [Actinomycetaceae bacterium]|nr:hypothetical protein [Actinomycetaceae bacterium]